MAVLCRGLYASIVDQAVREILLNDSNALQVVAQWIDAALPMLPARKENERREFAVSIFDDPENVVFLSGFWREERGKIRIDPFGVAVAVKNGEELRASIFFAKPAPFPARIDRRLVIQSLTNTLIRYAIGE